MKKMITWAFWFRSLFALIKGLIRSIEAPVVPIKLAIMLPINKKIELTIGVPVKEPFISITPEKTKRDARRIIKDI